jgi:hypothetical protein
MKPLSSTKQKIENNDTRILKCFKKSFFLWQKVVDVKVEEWLKHSSLLGTKKKNC